MSSYKNLIQNITSLYILQGANYLLPLIVLPYLVRILGVENFGLISFAQALMTYFLMLTDYGFNLSATKKIASNKSDLEKISSVGSSVLTIKLLLSVLGFLILSLLIFAFPKFRKDWAVYFASYLLVIGNAMLPVWYFQGIQRMKTITVVSIIGRGLGTICIFLFVKEKNDFVVAAFLQSLGWFLMGALGLGTMLRSKSFTFFFPTFQQIREEIIDGWHVFISTTAVGLYTASNTFLLGVLSTNTNVGYFSAAEKVVKALQGLIFPISQSIYPHVNSLFVKSKYTAKLFLKRFTMILGLGSLLLSFLIYILAPTIIHLLFGNFFDPSITALRWMALIPFVIAMNNIFGIQTMLTFGLNKSLSKVLGMACIFDLIIVVPLIYFYASEGAAMAVIFTEFFVALLMIGSLRKNKLLFHFTRLIHDEA